MPDCSGTSVLLSAMFFRLVLVVVEIDSARLNLKSLLAKLWGVAFGFVRGDLSGSGRRENFPISGKLKEARSLARQLLPLLIAIS